MARRSIKIARANGVDTINLDPNKLKCPDPFPEIEYEYLTQSYQMRRKSATEPGLRIHKTVGTDINHARLSFDAHRLDETEANLLISMFKTAPQVVLISLDSGSTRYFAVPIGEGFRPEPYPNNEDPDNAKAFFIRGRIELNIIQATTQNFVEV